ncbi:MAG: TonB-dependent receptor plug domain-containing protein, partial [Gammaproteobacteria bacterium]
RAFAPLLALYATTVATAAESPLELDEIVVTGQRDDSRLRTLPQSVSIITEREIRRSTATTVTELLRQEANLNLQSFFSTDKFATIDIRGMGATATSNVLVMVDGVRLP